MPRLLALCLLLPLAGCGASGKPRPAADLDFPVGAFALTERSGRTVTDADLKGKVWVASFVFTRCNGPCPAVTSTVARLQSELKLADRPDLRLVTFTVDPARDTLADLRTYADNRRAHPDRWLFLTGDEETVHKLLRERFKQGVSKKAGEVKEGDEFDHSTRLAVVDRAGVIRAVFDGMPNPSFPDADARFEANLTALKDKVAKLLAQN